MVSGEDRLEQRLHVSASPAESLVDGIVGQLGLVAPLWIFRFKDRVPVRRGHMSVNDQALDRPGGRENRGPVAAGVTRACRDQSHQLATITLESSEGDLGEETQMCLACDGSRRRRARRGRQALAAIGNPTDVGGRYGHRAGELMADFVDKGLAEEGTQILDGLGVLRLSHRTERVVQRVLGELAAPRAPLG